MQNRFPDDDDEEFFEDWYSGDPALTVVEEDSVSAAIAEAVAKFPAADDVFQAAAWVIARAPDKGALLKSSESEYRLLKLLPNSIVKSPGVLVRHRVEKNQVVVDWIKFLPFNERDAVSPKAYDYKGK